MINDVARSLLDAIGVVRAKDIELFKIADSLGIAVEEGEMEDLGRVQRLGRHAIIRLRKDGLQLGRFRFTFAHEIIHVVLEHTGSGSCEFSLLHAKKAQEREANKGASALLFPPHLVEERCQEATIENVLELAEEFRVGQQVAALGFVRLSKKPCAIVLADHGEVRWAAGSESWQWDLPCRNTPLHPESLSWELLKHEDGEHPEQSHSYTAETGAHCWVKDGSPRLMESVTVWPWNGYQTALSLLVEI